MKQVFKVVVFLVILALIMVPLAACTQPTWDGDQLIEDNAGYDGVNPQVAMDGLNVVAVWEQYDGTTTRIYSNYSTDGGASWGRDQLIEDNAGFPGCHPQVAMDGLNVVAVWDQKDGSSYRRIYSNYSNDGGATWHSDRLIEDNAGHNGWYSQVAISGSQVVAVWDQQDGSSYYRIYSNYSSDGGASWGSDQMIEDNAGFKGDFPQVAIDGLNVVAVWYQWDGSNDRIYSNYSDDGGASWHSDQLIEDNAGFHGGNPQVAIDGLNVVVVWFQKDGSSYRRIYSNYSSDGGANWVGDQLIENNTGNDGWYPQVAISGSQVVAVWDQQDGTTTRIYSNYSTDGGVNWVGDQLIEDNASWDGYAPQIAMDGLNVVAVWYLWDIDTTRIFSNYSDDGGASWDIDQLIEHNTGNDGLYPQVALSGLNAVAVWHQFDGTTNRIYSNYTTLPRPETPTS